MLGQGCLRALFWRTIDFHLKWVYDGFLCKFLGAKVGEKWVETHLSPTLSPFRDFRENPLFTQFKGVEIVFKKRAMRQSRPNIKEVGYDNCGAMVGRRTRSRRLWLSPKRKKPGAFPDSGRGFGGHFS